MKILQVLPALGQGGVERGAAEVARALCQAHIPNGVASSGGRLEAGISAAGTECITMPLASKNPLTIISNARRLARIVLDGGWTLMHVRSRAPAWSVRLASRATGVPFITTWHGLYGLKPRWLKVPYNRVMLSGAAVIAVSDCVKRHIVEEYGADENSIARIYRGADTDVFRPDVVGSDEAAAYRDALGVPRSAFLVSLPGRLTHWKGQDLLIEAAASDALSSREVVLAFAGSDQGRTAYSTHLKSLAAKLGVKALFIDHVDNMPLFYAASDVVVSASSGQPEAFGRVIPEAQAMGRIVVGTAHGGACETIEDGRTGFLCTPGDAKALAEAVARALALDDASRRRIAASAIESVRNRFSVKRMCEETIAFYRALHEGASVSS